MDPLSDNSRPTSRGRSNTDFTNHTWVPMTGPGSPTEYRVLNLVQFMDETEDISRIMSAPADMQSRSLTSSPLPQGSTMDYETIFGPFTSSMTSNYAPTSSPFGSQTSTSPFHQQASPPTSGNLGLERLVLNDHSPTQSFTGPGSQGARSPPFPDFDTSMATFTPTGMSIETMLDTTAMGEPSY